jgi:beta-glucanase (GH16 family)
MSSRGRWEKKPRVEPRRALEMRTEHFDKLSADADEYSAATPPPNRPRRGLRVVVITGVVVLAVVASFAVFDVLGRVGASVLPRLGSSGGTSVVLDENFDGSALDTRIWNTCHWWGDEGCTISSNDELEWYRPEQVAVSDGVLRLTADRIPTRGSDGKDYEYRSGMVTTGPVSSDDDQAKVSWTYGTVEARLRVPAGRGLWPAVWMLPVSRESKPEIDILEVIGQDPGEVLMHFHPVDVNEEDIPGKTYRLHGKTLAEGWHTIGLDWQPERLTWFVDGREVWHLRGDQVPDEPMYLVLNLAVGGFYPGPPDDSTKFPATFEIDRIRVTTTT